MRQTGSTERDSGVQVCRNGGDSWDNKDGPSRAVDATRPGPDHRSALPERG